MVSLVGYATIQAQIDFHFIQKPNTEVDAFCDEWIDILRKSGESKALYLDQILTFYSIKCEILFDEGRGQDCFAIYELLRKDCDFECPLEVVSAKYSLLICIDQMEIESCQRLQMWKQGHEKCVQFLKRLQEAPEKIKN